jgi:hypothetical protein
MAKHRFHIGTLIWLTVYTAGMHILLKLTGKKIINPLKETKPGDSK